MRFTDALPNVAMLAALLLAWAAGMPGAHAQAVTLDQLQAAYSARVVQRLEVPAPEVRPYALLSQAALDRAEVVLAKAQYLVTVDRSPWVQAVFVFHRSAQGEWRLVGASPASTGRPGSFDHFETPLGVFGHTTANTDFRAEGTFNSNGIRGYGLKGMRVFDFGWVRVPKGWGDRNVIEMRLQMHATDPDALERRLGTAQSKGCIRIPATLDVLLDHFGVIDAQYEERAAEGDAPWVLHADREPVEDAGRWLIVVESERDSRPNWSPAPFLPHVRK